jgi:hypothetical protein
VRHAAALRTLDRSLVEPRPHQCGVAKIPVVPSEVGVLGLEPLVLAFQILEPPAQAENQQGGAGKQSACHGCDLRNDGPARVLTGGDVKPLEGKTGQRTDRGDDG